MEVPRAWYPVCSSQSLGRGRTLAVQAFGTRLALFRRADGTPGALPARCPHFGADLAQGMVEGRHLRCPLHGRGYTVDGTCREGGAGIPALTVVERWGIVFVAWGGDPGFALPDIDDGRRLISSAVIWQTAPIALDAIGANAFDTAHLATVHARDLLGPAVVEVLSPWAIRIAFAARVAGSGIRDRLLRLLGVRDVELATTCWGGNLLVFHHRRVSTWTIHAAVPLACGSTATCTVSLRRRPTFVLSRVAVRIWLGVQHCLIMDFVAEDRVALQGVTAGPLALDAVADAALIAWRQHAAALPRTAVPPTAVPA